MHVAYKLRKLHLSETLGYYLQIGGSYDYVSATPYNPRVAQDMDRTLPERNNRCRKEHMNGGTHRTFAFDNMG